MVLAQISDIHLDDRSSRLRHLDPRRQINMILADIQRRQITDLIITGDISETAEGAEWLLARLESINARVLPCFGNHDLGNIGFYLDRLHLSLPYYRQDIAGQPCLFLDSSNQSIDEEQLSWISSEVRSLQGRIFIFTHYPVLDCGNSFMDRRYPLKGRLAFRTFLENSGREFVIFCGHYHYAMLVGDGRILQYITPSTFYQIKTYSNDLEIDPRPPGYRLIEIAQDGYRTSVQRVT
jgi:Icc protein